MTKCQFKARCGGGRACDTCRFAPVAHEKASNLSLKQKREGLEREKTALIGFKMSNLKCLRRHNDD